MGEKGKGRGIKNADPGRGGTHEGTFQTPYA